MMKSYPSCHCSADKPPSGVLSRKNRAQRLRARAQSQGDARRGSRDVATPRDPEHAFYSSRGAVAGISDRGGRRVGHHLWSYTGRPLAPPMIVGTAQCERAGRKGGSTCVRAARLELAFPSPSAKWKVHLCRTLSSILGARVWGHVSLVALACSRTARCPRSGRPQMETRLRTWSPQPLSHPPPLLWTNKCQCTAVESCALRSPRRFTLEKVFPDDLEAQRSTDRGKPSHLAAGRCRPPD